MKKLVVGLITLLTLLAIYTVGICAEQKTVNVGALKVVGYDSHSLNEETNARGEKILVNKICMNYGGSISTLYDGDMYVTCHYKWDSSRPEYTASYNHGAKPTTEDCSVYTSLYTLGISCSNVSRKDGVFAAGYTWTFKDKGYTPHIIIVECNGREYYYSIKFKYGSILLENYAYPSNSKLIVNGNEVSCGAYKIIGNNYFKIRDIAQMLKGTNAQFSVEWDDNLKAINLVSGGIYQSLGNELAAVPIKDKKTAKFPPPSLYKDGIAEVVRSYNIDGSNYFKLRDIGMIFNFYIGWDEATNCITIDTTKPYTE